MPRMLWSAAGTPESPGYDSPVENEDPTKLVIKGLDEDAMSSWWKNFKSDSNSDLDLLDQNCATSTAQALAAGGGDFYALIDGWEPPLTWTPSAVEDYAKHIQNAIEKWNRFRRQFNIQ